ncbi:hypothetical protein HYH03_014833 [Edaphochlamys debaryana]|uniref:U-box domain-containing protein n=1 Tax=Edaphochlamys debaryana TaxID=47281 RepID=A0A835XNC9_9CHLO|nr:hypothetical protein HYH03_014833 [Edaphochlamys debaryana]|eukprot:KAG2486532.1 hypothetical protein HYH03_014833 [Edaphochlamys debaryana]
MPVEGLPYDENDGQLFESPVDLVCPILHELFTDPVINSAGQVYERVAIEKALAHRLVDPISNQPVTNQLTTVWPMKSKAAAYRERAVRGCVAQVCRPSCRTPIRYLRRAAELAAGAAGCPPDCGSCLLGAPGLTPEVVDYVLTHPSSIYDFQALSRFASSLAACGHRDLAAGLYTKMLQLGGDSQAQVEALQGLLACWGGEEEEDEERLVERLAALSLGEGPEGCRPARFVGVLLAAGLPEALVVRFCEYILGGAGGGAGSGGPGLGTVGSTGGMAIPGTGNGAGMGPGGPHRVSRCSSIEYGGAAAGGGGGANAAVHAGVAVGANANADLLYIYTKLRCGRLDAALAQRRAVAGGSSAAASGAAGWAGPEKAAPQGLEGGPQGGGGEGGGHGRGWWRRRRVQRAVCSGVYALACLVGAAHPVTRVVQAASVLVLVHTR